MRALVIGGGGFLGHATARALESTSIWEVWRGSRSRRSEEHWFKIDISDREAFGSLRQFDLIVNCSDSIGVQPDELVAFCLLNKLHLIEMSADVQTLRRLLSRWRSSGIKEQRPSGSVVLGMGLFPGLSNVLAGSLVRRVSGCTSLRVTVGLSPFSGAGRGMIRLMVRLLATPPSDYINGKKTTPPRIVAGPTVLLSGTRRSTLRVALPEALMLHWSTGVPSIEVLLAPRPRWLSPLLLFTAAVLTRQPALTSALSSTLESVMFLTRGVILRRTPAEIEIHAVARAELPSPHASSLTASVGNGIEAAAELARAGAVLLKKAGYPDGLYLPDELFDLNPLLTELGDLTSRRLAFKLKASENSAI
jgi:hypothetical protein